MSDTTTPKCKFCGHPPCPYCEDKCHQPECMCGDGPCAVACDFSLPEDAVVAWSETVRTEEGWESHSLALAREIAFSSWAVDNARKLGHEEGKEEGHADGFVDGFTAAHCISQGLTESAALETVFSGYDRWKGSLLLAAARRNASVDAFIVHSSAEVDWGPGPQPASIPFTVVNNTDAPIDIKLHLSRESREDGDRFSAVVVARKGPRVLKALPPEGGTSADATAPKGTYPPSPPAGPPTRVQLDDVWNTPSSKEPLDRTLLRLREHDTWAPLLEHDPTALDGIVKDPRSLELVSAIIAKVLQAPLDEVLEWGRGVRDAMQAEVDRLRTAPSAGEHRVRRDWYGRGKWPELGLACEDLDELDRWVAEQSTTSLDGRNATRRNIACVRTHLVDLYDSMRTHERLGDRPKIVCLCGSTRFYDDFQRVNAELTGQGLIVLSVGFVPGAEHGESVGTDPITKARLDELHKKKIDLADFIFVINKGGYIGDSTRSEIEHAIRIGREVRYLEDPAGGAR